MKTILITGAAKRGGATIAKHAHVRGCRVVLHCRSNSVHLAENLALDLNTSRPDSAIVWEADLNEHILVPPYLDTLVGIVANASNYVHSDLDCFEGQFGDDMNSHVVGHLKLIKHCKQALSANNGAIVAITDIHVERPTKGYLTYQIAKGALASMVRALAIELAPEIRVNAVAPGPLEWPTNITKERKESILRTTPLVRAGTFDELAKAVCFLLFDATFTTGSTLNVDGGRSTYLE